MNSLVGDKIRVITKAFPTIKAFVGLLSSVNSLVGIEVGTVTKAFPTFETFVGLLTYVCPLVSNEVGGPTEAFHICVTLVGFLGKVQTLMVNKFFQILFRRTFFPPFLWCISCLLFVFVFMITVIPPFVRVANNF